MNPPVEQKKPAPRRAWLIGAVLGLAALIGLLHGRSVGYGLFMDDHAHYRQLRACGWSLAELTRACRLELVGGVIELWWLPECTVRFFRPLAFGVMKLAYTLGGWNPAVLHVLSLLWHLLNCLLVLLLLRRLGASRALAWAVACLFALHPAQVATIQWIAAQTELLVTTLLLAGLLCYGQFRGWSPATDRIGTPPPGRLRWKWGIGCAVFFGLALFCRENALALPLVLLATELFAFRLRRREGLGLVAVLGVISLAYFLLRWHYLGGTALPPRPYVVPPSDPDFARYVLDKACYYLLGEFLLVPCVPIGGLAYFRERPAVFYGLTLLVAAVLVMLVVRNRRRLAGALAPACLLGFMLPVLPAFESPHHLYLPGVGWAIFAWLLLGELNGLRSERARSRWRKAAAGTLATLTAVVFAVTTHFFGMAFEAAQAVEDQMVAEIATAPEPIEDGDTLYVANLPAVAHYLRLAVEERTGRRDLRLVALSWAPRLLGMSTPSELAWRDQRTIELEVAEDRYFSGPLGLLTRQASGGRMPPPVGQPVRCQGFTVEVGAADAGGVRVLRFVFDDAVPAKGVHLFWGSRTRWACQLTRQGAATTGAAR